MTPICSICRQPLQAGRSGAEPGFGFGLCNECRQSFQHQHQGRSLAPVLERYSEPVLVVDASGRLLACNRLAEAALGRPVASLLGLQPGEVLACTHASEGEGCGKTPYCGACAMRLALNYTVSHGRGCEHMPATLDCTHKGKPAVRRFTLSTQRMGELVRVLMEDDGYLPAY